MCLIEQQLVYSGHCSDAIQDHQTVPGLSLIPNCLSLENWINLGKHLQIVMLSIHFYSVIKITPFVNPSQNENALFTPAPPNYSACIGVTV